MVQVDYSTADSPAHISYTKAMIKCYNYFRLSSWEDKVFKSQLQIITTKGLVVILSIESKGSIVGMGGSGKGVTEKTLRVTTPQGTFTKHLTF